MLLSREEMRFDFGGAKLDPVADRDVIAFAVQQFLYGEVTGIQVGHWLYNAPDLDAARFFARQSLEEMQHVGNFLRILEILGVEAQPAHPAIRFLATGMMPSTFEEHVALEMALGEGLVLEAFYALIETVEHPEIVAILKRGVRQEESHVAFGERRTKAAIESRPALRRRLLGTCLMSLWVVSRFGRYLEKKMPPEHPLLRQIPAFVAHVVKNAEIRLRRIGVLDRPLASIGPAARVALVGESYATKAVLGFLDVLAAPFRLLPWFARKRLTETYLSDPMVRGHALKAQSADDAEAST